MDKETKQEVQNNTEQEREQGHEQLLITLEEYLESGSDDERLVLCKLRKIKKKLDSEEN